MEEKNYDYLFKILVIGDYKVGKTSLITRFSQDIFSEDNFLTFAIDFKTKIIEIDNKLIKVALWDPCSGSERFLQPLNSHYRGSHGIVINYDITDKQKFINLRKWIDEILKKAPLETRMILIGNKCDLSNERKVTEEEGKKLADEFGMLFFETSAKTGYNVNFAIETLIADIIKHYKKFEERKIKLKKDDTKNINDKKNRCYK